MREFAFHYFIDIDILIMLFIEDCSHNAFELFHVEWAASVEYRGMYGKAVVFFGQRLVLLVSE